LAQDDYYYEIQLTNKQLVFYFIAAAAGFILSFVAGIMVGRGVDTGEGGTVQVREEKVATFIEEPSPTPGSVNAEALTYSQRLEDQRIVERLTTPTPPTVSRVERPTATPIVAQPSPRRPAPTPRPTATRAASASQPSAPRGGLTIQVGAFQDKAAAESLRARLQGKGLPAYVVASSGSFKVRVGSYATRADAEKMKARLESQEKLNSFIVAP
jgi:cell division septation protein DedD